MNCKLISAGVLTFVGLGCAFAQSLNIDLDAFIGDQGTGNGAPSSGFGGRQVLRVTGTVWMREPYSIR